MLDLDDVRWELGRFGKLNVRHGKGSRCKGPKPRLVPLINGAGRGLRWFLEDVAATVSVSPPRPTAYRIAPSASSPHVASTCTTAARVSVASSVTPPAPGRHVPSSAARRFCIQTATAGFAPAMRSNSSNATVIRSAAGQPSSA